MGNSVYNYLKDPKLVRSIQECLGVKQILPHAETAHDGGVPAGINGVLSNGNLGWLATKVKRRKRLKQPTSSSGAPPSSHKAEESRNPPDIIVETIPVLDIFFRLATELGYEPFYITFIPFFIWNVDTFMTRHIVVMWIGSMYLGQACKALFRWERPASPPAIRLEHNPSLETEFGFPSTHATVSTTIPFYLAYRAFLRYEASHTTKASAAHCHCDIFNLDSSVDWTACCSYLVWICVSQQTLPGRPHTPG